MVVMVLLRRSFKSSLPLRDKLHALRFVANYRRLNRGITSTLVWCEIRNTVISWTRTRFPFHVSSAKKLNVTDPPIITVVGKAYFDVSHAPKDQSNRRKYLPGYAAWEIHPVMTLTVQ
jgi:hypothetical protein